ncbi:Sonic hedgehog protein [Gracilariopsis chorda]|uniref:Sonic hedgehog protein n=1 Tax=Gracilariopsis chorda TaxID=448386 RepID=A0A2V3IFE6_9FLOR|nr:Sonic hedgehog protein [Gracilariopsis chorda]|eukprot:PXF40815.1 Sonic hedgehog protein [Gracilariopsis chorda]
MVRIAAIFIYSLLFSFCVAQQRKMTGDRVEGFFGRFMEVVPGTPVKEECSKLVKHFGQATPNDNGTVLILTGSIQHNGNKCREGTMLMHDSPETNPVAGVGKADETFDNLQVSDGFWVGESTRNCGRWQLPKPTAVFMVYDKNRKLVGPYNVPLEKGFTYMIFTNKRFTCIYRDVPPPSPRPSPKAPSPKPVAPSEADGETFSAAEDINDGDTVGVPVTVLPGVPKESAEATAEDDDGSTCFPADTTVELEDGSVKEMAQVNIGDRVRVGRSMFSEVFMFTHRLQDGENYFVKIETDSSGISLTKGHYLFVNGVLAAAKTVQVGDLVELASGETATVRAVKKVKGTGLYNPQTISGDIVVNGIRASTYTTTVDPAFAHRLLTPFRALYQAFGVATSAFERGAVNLAKLAPQGAAIL